MSDRGLLVKVRIAVYAVSGGFPFVIRHHLGCRGHVYDDQVLECIGKTDAKVMTELAIRARAVLKAVRCSEECGIEKDSSDRILFGNHF